MVNGDTYGGADSYRASAVAKGFSQGRPERFVGKARSGLVLLSIGMPFQGG
jgi:hypothetical protein